MLDRIKVLIIFGTRPEAIKMAPLILQFRKDRRFDARVCVTAQHRQMLDQVLAFFEIEPDYDLDLMQPNQTLFEISANILMKIKPVFEDFQADYAFVHGDTSTSMVASLAAFYSKTKVCHIEAGLRTYNKHSPFLEEMNCQLTGRLADFHFAPTENARQNLLRENVNTQTIIVTGNTVIDALLIAKDKVEEVNEPEIEDLKPLLRPGKKLILVTGHRRENFGEGFENICLALLEIAQQENIQVIYPVHLNPNVQKPVNEILSNHDNIHLINPLSYPAFIWLMKRADLILTDSGGIQEEAPSLGKPVLVMRENTERPEALVNDCVRLVGTQKQNIVQNVQEIMQKDFSTITFKNPFGDGNACAIIADFILKKHSGTNK